MSDTLQRSAPPVFKARNTKRLDCRRCGKHPGIWKHPNLGHFNLCDRCFAGYLRDHENEAKAVQS